MDRKPFHLSLVMIATLVGVFVVVVAAAVGLLRIFPQLATAPTTSPASAPASAPSAGAPPASAPATDWPMFRGGPALTGTAPGLLAEELEFRWRFRTGGPVKSSAAVVGGRVFIGSNDGKVYALRLTDGEELWERETGKAVRAAPCVARIGGEAPGAERVFVGSADGKLYALDAATGQVAWTYDTGGDIEAPAHCTRLNDGRRAVLVGSFDHSLHCVDARTGQEIWTFPTGERIYGAPAVAVGKVVFGGRDGFLRVLGHDGRELIRREVGPCVPGSIPVVAGRGYVALYGSAFQCIELETGDVAWSYGGEDSEFFSSPAVTADRVLVGGRDARLHCLDRRSGRRMWAFAARDSIDSSPAVCDGKVVFGSDDGRLYMVRLDDGRRLWSHEIGDVIGSSPAVASGWVVVGCDDRYVYAFGPKGP